jgi:hypothetical protein
VSRISLTILAVVALGGALALGTVIRARRAA